VCHTTRYSNPVLLKNAPTRETLVGVVVSGPGKCHVPTFSNPGDSLMKLLITRPVVLAGDGGARSFVPGLTVEVDAATAEQILAQDAGIAIEPVANTESLVTPRRRKSADAET